MKPSHGTDNPHRKRGDADAEKESQIPITFGCSVAGCLRPRFTLFLKLQIRHNKTARADNMGRENKGNRFTPLKNGASAVLMGKNRRFIKVPATSTWKADFPSANGPKNSKLRRPGVDPGGHQNDFFQRELDVTAPQCPKQSTKARKRSKPGSRLSSPGETAERKASNSLS